jgi:hypothetical protein
VSRWRPELLRLRLAPPARTADQPALDRGERLALTLSAFERQLDSQRLAPRTRLQGIVGGELARYAVVPWNDGLHGAQRRQQFAAHCLTETYGEPARDWTVRVDEPRYGQPALACALDSSLLDGLMALVTARRLVLASLQPALMDAFNAARSRVDGRSCWFALIEPASITLLLIQDAAPTLVRRIASEGVDLARAVARESFALGLHPVPPTLAAFSGVPEGGALAGLAPTDGAPLATTMPAR